LQFTIILYPSHILSNNFKYFFDKFFKSFLFLFWRRNLA
jgi:hypothetical protein